MDVAPLSILQSFRLFTEGWCLNKEVWLKLSPAQLCQFKLLRVYLQLSPSGSNKNREKYTNPSLWSQRPFHAGAEQGKLLTSPLCSDQVQLNYLSTCLNFTVELKI